MYYKILNNIKKTAAVSGMVLLSGVMYGQKSIPNKLITYAAPQEAVQNGDFSVKVRVPGGTWKEISEYMIKVDEVRDTGHQTQDASLSYFDFDGEVEVAVIFNRGTINTSKVRPISYGIKHEIKGNTLSFKLNKPANLSVEINGDIMHNLHLFANPINSYLPDRKDKKLIYFGPGHHFIRGGKLTVPSDCKVYVDGAAIIVGQIRIENAQNVKVFGSGMVDQSVK